MPHPQSVCNMPTVSQSAPRFMNGESVARTMSSREIADLVDARHNDVVATIDRLFGKGLLRSSRNTRREATGGRPIDVYDLVERDSHLVVAGYSDEHRAKVIDRWQELEVGQALKLPTSFAEALRGFADQLEQNAVLVIANTQQAKKIESLEHLFMAGETPSQFVKRLNGVNAQKINATLVELGWVYNSESDPARSPKYRASSKARSQLLLTERPRKIEGEGLESPIIRYDLQILEKGATKLHDLYLELRLTMKKTWDQQFSYAKFVPEVSL